MFPVVLCVGVSILILVSFGLMLKTNFVDVYRVLKIKNKVIRIVVAVFLSIVGSFFDAI
ncbi:hypothetical protein IGI37_000639 [Enterococcus sp. AZ194]